MKARYIALSQGSIYFSRQAECSEKTLLHSQECLGCLKSELLLICTLHLEQEITVIPATWMQEVDIKSLKTWRTFWDDFWPILLMPTKHIFQYMSRSYKPCLCYNYDIILYITNLNLFAKSVNISLYKENEMHLVLTMIWKGKTHKSTLSKLELITSKLVNCERKLFHGWKGNMLGFKLTSSIFFKIITGFLQYVKNCTLKFSCDLLIP